MEGVYMNFYEDVQKFCGGNGLLSKQEQERARLRTRVDKILALEQLTLNQEPNNFVIKAGRRRILTTTRHKP